MSPHSATAPAPPRPVTLTPTERRLFDHLVAHAGRVVTRAELLDRVWPLTEQPSSALVTTYVRSLRQKLDDEPDAPVIETVRGVGYLVRTEPRTH